MKRYGGLYPKIYDMGNLHLAHRHARKNKGYYREVRMVDEDEDKYLKAIQTMLVNKAYAIKADDYSISTINDKGKERELWHRIIQWAIMLQIEPVFMEVFCRHTCASLKGRGIKLALELTEAYLKDEANSRYCLKIDIAKFYPNINHAVLKAMLRRKFKDKDLLALLDMIVDSTQSEKGVPIGSYLSQFLANFYLAYFDHWLKEYMGARSVVRYMDDVVIFHSSKRYLHELLAKIKKYLADELKLQLKPNWQIFPVDARGVDFVGYRFFHGYTLLRKRTCQKFKRRMRRIRAKSEAGKAISFTDWCSANSYAGWLKWCDSWRLWEKYIEPVAPALLSYYKGYSGRNAASFSRRLYEKKGRKRI